LSDAYFSSIETLGASVLFIIEYVPTTAGTANLVITKNQKAKLLNINFTSNPAFPIIKLPGDDGFTDTCPSAGRGFLHLSAEGKIEACPFAPFSDSDAGATGLAQAMNSPMMRTIRDSHSSQCTATGGCALWKQQSIGSHLTKCGNMPIGV
jgi:MoaA/NifB/PqqE/SkfB family radical SAM enzyme